MSGTREALATRVDGDILAEIKALAKAEGRDLDTLIDEALGDLLEKRRRSEGRPHVMAAHRRSHERFASLYAKLAK